MNTSSLTENLDRQPDDQITIVSGLPRSGTSLMMQMLACGGMPVITDDIRAADADNPRGYFELEKVKRTRQDASWLPTARGKAFKMISQLLYDLPGNEKYRIIFMQRHIEEVLSSQETMLKRLGREAAQRDEMRQSYALHLERLEAWLEQQTNIEVLRVNYNRLVEHPEAEATRVSSFVGRRLNVKKMADAIDSALYRNRTQSIGK